jgi:hypothetical protein
MYEVEHWKSLREYSELEGLFRLLFLNIHLKCSKLKKIKEIALCCS